MYVISQVKSHQSVWFVAPSSLTSILPNCVLPSFHSSPFPFIPTHPNPTHPIPSHPSLKDLPTVRTHSSKSHFPISHFPSSINQPSNQSLQNRPKLPSILSSNPPQYTKGLGSRIFSSLGKLFFSASSCSIDGCLWMIDFNVSTGPVYGELEFEM